ncbi:plasmid mobilization protein [Neorhizobium huautlense]|uniref:plasmid mobilization protein n=1 Tax=Neorhizobium huautlense TaxID=67774 RepID=UPI000CFA45E0|nr:plasmid mobilization relaxosome protein MobC [Neorhizobium huautlense]
MRARILRVRTTDTEFSKIKDIAIARGLSISELVRRAALGIRLPARTFDAKHAFLLARTLAAIGRVGGNLNQLVKLANSGRIVGHHDDLSRILADIDALRSRLRELLT